MLVAKFGSFRVERRGTSRPVEGDFGALVEAHASDAAVRFAGRLFQIAGLLLASGFTLVSFVRRLSEVRIRRRFFMSVQPFF